MSASAPVFRLGQAFRLVVAAALLQAAPATASAGTPHRVVSVNLCTDQLLVLLADRQQIASVSFLAADPALSYVAGRIGGLPLNYGRAEEIAALGPDLVLAGLYAARPTVQLLRAQGIRVIETGLPADWPAITAQTLELAAALGHPDRGEAMVAAMQGALAAAAPAPGTKGPLALFYQANGFTSGKGTLADLILLSAGYRNFAADAGLDGYGFLPLETIVAGAPDLLILDRTPDQAPSLSDALLDHPALARVMAGKERLDVPAWSLGCGGPYTAEAVTALAAGRDRLAAEP